MLTAFDYGTLAIVLLSALQGMWRGLLAELFALVGWIAAFLIAAYFTHHLVPYLPANLPGGELTRQVVAFVAIVVLVLVAAGVLGALLGRLTELAGLRSVDRSLGMLFGLLRGVILVLVVVALAGFTRLPEQAFWRNGQLLPYANQGVRYAKQFLPGRLADYVHVGPAEAPAIRPKPKAGVAPRHKPGERDDRAAGNITHL